jgi:hypothetical protein
MGLGLAWVGARVNMGWGSGSHGMGLGFAGPAARGAWPGSPLGPRTEAYSRPAQGWGKGWIFRGRGRIRVSVGGRVRVGG